MPPSEPLENDPLDDPRYLPDSYLGAVLLSDQLEYYIRRLTSRFCRILTHPRSAMTN